jgi:hypothetical protein
MQKQITDFEIIAKYNTKINQKKLVLDRKYAKMIFNRKEKLDDRKESNTDICWTYSFVIVGTRHAVPNIPLQPLFVRICHQDPKSGIRRIGILTNEDMFVAQETSKQQTIAIILIYRGLKTTATYF